MDWHRQLRIVLSVEDKLNYLEQPIPLAPVPAQADQQEEGQSVSSYVLKMKSYIDHIECLGHPLSLNLGVSLILISMRKEFDSFVQNYNMHSMGKTVNELHAMLKLHEQTLTKKDPALHVILARKPKIPPPSKRENPAKDSICHQCGDTGHWKRNCPQYLAELLKNKKLSQGASGSSIFTIELYTFPNKSWVYDTGCGTHIYNTTQGFRGSKKLKPGALSFSMYAVSNKRAKLNLDSALLWHCRLGHISKKRIEKLQHDGLLNSTDLRAFEKCVSCMSGKMARKPYTHQVERAKDLLGLIHTDVCGPFRTVSRQGSSYFITFTDEFSRYGYVYLLKHKHKVFETFKVFQKEVENQLEKTIKSLRSDRGEEDTHPSINTSSHHKEDDLEIDEPQSDIIPIRKSIRTRHAPNRMCLYVDAEEHELGDLGESTNYKAALLDHEYDKWLDVMNVEMQSMIDNEVWDLVDHLPNVKNIGSKWLFKKKTDIDGAVHTFKARLVAKGFTQTYGVDYEETFSLVADIRAIRILIGISTYYDYEIWQMDVKTTFLNRHLSEEINHGNNIQFTRFKSYPGNGLYKDLGGSSIYSWNQDLQIDHDGLIGVCVKWAYIEKSKETSHGEF
ncbi:retrotransposon protein, putative, ty1-copia subclass [Tanacetum coccineum]